MAELQQTFIMKYKPYFIDDFGLDPKLLTILKTLLELDSLNLLLIGDTSVGKTTLLYALIRAYYGLSKSAPFPENNILFINNLKEQGIQYFRNEMKTFCQSRSAIYGRKKLVIIDDIDNINEQSQQVFRNYIDKYHNNINFISVCTNIQKVIESIQSRINIVKLKPLSKTQIHHIMDKIIVAEGLKIDEESKEHLLVMANHSIRVVLNYLEKIYILDKPINIELCRKICSTISFQHFDEYCDCLKEGRLNDGISVLSNIYDYGYSVTDILDYFFTFVKTTQIIDEETKYKMIPFLCKYITIFHNLHEDNIELALFTNNLMQMMHA